MGKKRVAVIGAGLSGLSAGYALSLDADTDVDVYEVSDRVGGNVRTDEKGGFLYELGPQSMRSKYDEVCQLHTILAEPVTNSCCLAIAGEHVSAVSKTPLTSAGASRYFALRLRQISPQVYLRLFSRSRKPLVFR